MELPRTGGLTTRHFIAILMMLAAQIIATVVMLQMMLRGNCGVEGEGAGMGWKDLRDIARVSFGVVGDSFGGRGNEGVGPESVGGHIVVKAGEGMGGARSVKMEKDMMMLDGKMDASQYLLSAEQSINERITGHRAFVTQKKNSLVEVLWEIIEGVYELEELTEVISSTSSMETESGAGHSKASKKGRKVMQFRTEVEEKMEKGDFEGVLKLFKRSLKKAGGKIEKGNFKIETSSKDESDERMKTIEHNKIKIAQGLSASWKLLQEMEEEMKDMERWLRGIDEVLGEVVSEFMGEL